MPAPGVSRCVASVSTGSSSRPSRRVAAARRRPASPTSAVSASSARAPRRSRSLMLAREVDGVAAVARERQHERGEHRHLRVAEPLEHGRGVRIEVTASRSASTSSKRCRLPGSSRNGSLRRTRPASATSGSARSSTPGGLEEAPRPHRAVAEQVEEARRSRGGPTARSPRSTRPSQSSSPSDGGACSRGGRRRARP